MTARRSNGTATRARDLHDARSTRSRRRCVAACLIAALAFPVRHARADEAGATDADPSAEPSLEDANDDDASCDFGAADCCDPDAGLCDPGSDAGGGGSGGTSIPLACDGGLCDTTNGSMCTVVKAGSDTTDWHDLASMTVIGALVLSTRLCRRNIRGRAG